MIGAMLLSIETTPFVYLYPDDASHIFSQGYDAVIVDCSVQHALPCLNIPVIVLAPSAGVRKAGMSLLDNESE